MAGKITIYISDGLSPIIMKFLITTLVFCACSYLILADSRRPGQNFIDKVDDKGKKNILKMSQRILKGVLECLNINKRLYLVGIDGWTIVVLVTFADWWTNYWLSTIVLFILADKGDFIRFHLARAVNKYGNLQNKINIKSDTDIPQDKYDDFMVRIHLLSNW